MKNSNTELITETEKYKYAKEWHKEFPPMVVVSITNVCNLRCTHCYYSKFIELPDYHALMMPWELWEKICEEVGKWPGVVLNFGTDGEPLLHPKMIDMLRLARKHGISPINITTNGLPMDKEFNEVVVKEELCDIINISIDAYTDETYQKIRGGNFTKLKNNVLGLIDKRNDAESKMKIQVNFIDQPDANDELEGFKGFWEPKVDLVMIRTYYDATSQIGQTGPNITGKQEEFEKVERWPCQQFWRRFNIAEDGTARFCVDDWFNKTKVGDLKTQSIQEIWTSEEYDRLRHLQIEGLYNKISYCAKCTEWQGMKWDYDYFTAMEKMLDKNIL